MRERRKILCLRDSLGKCSYSAIGFFRQYLEPLLTTEKYGFMEHDRRSLEVMLKIDYTTISKFMAELEKQDVLREVCTGYMCPPLIADEVKKTFGGVRAENKNGMVQRL